MEERAGGLGGHASRRIRVWEAWQGNEVQLWCLLIAWAPPSCGTTSACANTVNTAIHLQKFLCWGHLITGPNWKPTVGTVFILVAPVVIYLTFVASYMTIQRSAAIMVFRLVSHTLHALLPCQRGIA